MELHLEPPLVKIFRNHPLVRNLCGDSELQPKKGKVCPPLFLLAEGRRGVAPSDPVLEVSLFI